MYSTSSSGQFSTASSTTCLVAPTDRRDQTASQHFRGHHYAVEGQSSASASSETSTAAANTPSAYLTYAGIGASTAALSASSYLPSIIDNDNIEESFVDISSVPVSSSPNRHQQQSGFVPPIIDPIPREPSYNNNNNNNRDQTQPQNLSVNRAETGSDADNRNASNNNDNRSHDRLELSQISRDNQGIVRQERDNNNPGILKQEHNNNNNNRGNHSNSNNSRKSIKTSHETSNILRSIPQSNVVESMVTSNAAMSLQNQLAGWHIPVSLGGSNSSPHHQPAHPHNHGGGGGGLVGGGQQMMMEMTSTPPKQHHSSGPRRHTGPRQPKNDSNISPEEAERRKVRRERNKLAAAKCRKRRMDHTAQLQDETDELESVQREIHGEILSLQQQKEQLEFILQAHKVHCKRGIPITTLPPVRIPALTLPAPSNGDDGGFKDELASNLSNDSLSSTTSNYSPAPTAALQMQMTTTTAVNNAAAARPTNSGANNNGGNLAPAVLSFTAALNIAANKDAARFVPNVAAVTAAAPTLTISSAAASTTATAAAHRPTSLPFIVKQEPPFGSKIDQQQQQNHEDVKPEAMDISVTQATGVSISTPKVSPRVLSLFDVIDHTGLTPITGGGVITSASNTPISTSAPAMSGGGGFTPSLPNASSSYSTTPLTTKMGTPTDRTNAQEKPSSGQTTLMSL